MTRACRHINRVMLQSPLVPYVLFVVLVIGVVFFNGRSQDAADQRQTRESANGRKTLCEYTNRIADGARLDREFLIVLSSRPGVTVPPDREAIVRAYLEFGSKAYPHLDCEAVVAGAAPPPLPPLPPSPLATTPAD